MLVLGLLLIGGWMFFSSPGADHQTPPTPVAGLRWQALLPPTTHSDRFEATSVGAMCPQFPSLLSGGSETGNDSRITGVEDCLYLNIWAPADASNLPVMVWIHGGGNPIGHGGSYVGPRLATSQQVVVVTINPDNFGDGVVFPAMTAQQIFSDQANYNAVPVILGTNRDETALFMARNPEYTYTYFGIFSRLKDPAHYKRLVHYQSQAWKERGVDSLARLMRANGHPDVFAYRFDWDEEPSLLGFDLATALGAAHGLEIAFVFGEFERGMGLSYLYPGDEAQYRLSDSMMSYWAAFAWMTRSWTPRQSNAIWQVIHTSINIRERCQLYVNMFRRNAAWDETEYLSLGGSGCGEFDPKSLASF